MSDPAVVPATPDRWADVRTLMAGSAEPDDERGCWCQAPRGRVQGRWAVLCFRIRVGYRRRGVATALLSGLVDYARQHGAPGLEAYPIDAAGQRLDAGFSFVGLVSMFDRAGFQTVGGTTAHSVGRERVVMRRMFARDAS